MIACCNLYKGWSAVRVFSGCFCAVTFPRSDNASLGMLLSSARSRRAFAAHLRSPGYPRLCLQRVGPLTSNPSLSRSHLRANHVGPQTDQRQRGVRGMSGLVLNTKQQSVAARPSPAGNTKQLISRKPVAVHSPAGRAELLHPRLLTFLHRDDAVTGVWTNAVKPLL